MRSEIVVISKKYFNVLAGKMKKERRKSTRKSTREKKVL
jgi:hypothetical protein